MPQLSGIQVALRGSQGQGLADKAIIFFDSPINRIGTAITYNTTTGEFTISQTGYYRVDWWATIDGSNDNMGLVIALNVNGSIYSRAVAPPVTSQVSGSALVTINDVPATFTITNESGHLVTFETNVAIQANIVIMAVPL